MKGCSTTGDPGPLTRSGAWSGGFFLAAREWYPVFEPIDIDRPSQWGCTLLGSGAAGEAGSQYIREKKNYNHGSNGGRYIDEDPTLAGQQIRRCMTGLPYGSSVLPTVGGSPLADGPEEGSEGHQAWQPSLGAKERPSCCVRLGGTMTSPVAPCSIQCCSPLEVGPEGGSWARRRERGAQCTAALGWGDRDCM